MNDPKLVRNVVLIALWSGLASISGFVFMWGGGLEAPQAAMAGMALSTLGLISGYGGHYMETHRGG